MPNNHLPIVIIGAGPIGLAAAMHLLSHDQKFVIYEMGDTVGSSIAEWSHIKMFSSWSLNVDNSMLEMLKKNDWKMPKAEEFPTGADLVQNYLVPISNLPGIKECLFLNHKVVYINRQNTDKASLARQHKPFEVTVSENNDSRHIIQARGIIDASGTWKSPNPIGGSGHFAEGEKSCEHIFYGMPEVLNQYKNRYAGKDTVVVGGGHSAINALLDLMKLKSQQNHQGTITWLLRNKTDNNNDQPCRPSILPERGALSDNISSYVASEKIRVVDNFSIREITSLGSGRLLLRGQRNDRSSVLETDEIIACTGARPDISLARELQLALDAYFECPIGVSELIRKARQKGEAIPEPHGLKALQHPEPDYFTVGMKSHGRAPNFFLMSGYEQVRSICAYFAGDMQAANKIEFSYPEDGVCGGACGEGNCCGPSDGSSGGSCGSSGGGGGCCGPSTSKASATKTASSCCA